MWATLTMPGRTVAEVHVIPLGDTPPHTAPICWCRPVRKTTERIWRHNRLTKAHCYDPLQTSDPSANFERV